MIAQTDTTLAGLLAGRLRWDSRVQRLALARELLTIYSKLDTIFPTNHSWEYLGTEVRPPQSKKYHRETRQQLDQADRAITGITNSLRYIADTTKHSLKKEMFFWVNVCIGLLDDEAFQIIARLNSKGVISVPIEFAISKSAPPGSQPRKYARAIIEHFVAVYVFSLKETE